METRKNGALLPFVVALLSALLCFCSPLPAYADEIEDDSPAYEVWAGYKDSSITEFNLYHKVVEDLAYRWFMASDAKRAKVPLQSKALGSYKQLSQYVEDYDTPDEQWQAFYNDFHPSYIVRMYSLVTYEDSLSTWSVSDSYAYQHFKEWFEWFEGSSSGGDDGPTEQDGLVFIPIEGWETGYATVNPHASYVVTTAERWQWLNDGYSNVYFTGNSNANGILNGSFTSSNEQLYYFEILPGATNTGLLTTNRFGSKSTTRPAGKTLTARSGNIVTVNGVECYDFRTGSNYNQIFDGTFNVGGAESVNWWGSSLMPVTLRIAGATGGGGGEDDGTQHPVYPEPDTPDMPTPSNPIYVDNDTTTTTVDLTPILDALRIINTNIVIGFNAIEDDFTAFVEYFGEWQDALWSELRSVNAWLERIFYKTSGGGSSDEPDIIIDGDGWWSWLGTIASMLLGDLAGAVAGLGGAFDALHGLFPFSIPWDVAALLGLFVSDPVTPVFDVPMPFGFADGAAQTATVHVDLTAWDGVMAAVRSVELAIFALGLALKTRDMLRNTEVEQ